MKRILVSRNQKLIDCEVYNNSEEHYEVSDDKSISVSLISRWKSDDSGIEPIVYIQIGNVFESSFLVIELHKGDYFYVN